MTGHSLFEIVADFYRARRTADLLLKLVEMNQDVINAFMRLCKKNNISVSEEIYRMIEGCSRIAEKIAESNSLDASQLLPPTSEHPKFTPEDGAEPEFLKYSRNSINSNNGSGILWIEKLVQGPI